jgi:16S rRNA G966 N2-methylase RsmD
MSGKRKKTPDFCDIELSRWNDPEYQDILTDSWWDLPSRTNTNGHQLDYHGNFIPQIANQTFRRFTKERDVIVDWFLGSGTSAIEAANLNRRLIGVELKPDLVDCVRAKLPPEKLDKDIQLIPGDSASPEAASEVKAALAKMGKFNAQLAVLHPPYADIISFSDRPEDLSNCESTEAFLDGFCRVASNAYALLQPGRFAVLIIGDKYCSGVLDPLGFKCMQVMNEVGFKTKSIIVKNITGNEIAKGKSNNLWRYRALAGGFYIFKHEYVMVFFK